MYFIGYIHQHKYCNNGQRLDKLPVKSKERDFCEGDSNVSIIIF